MRGSHLGGVLPSISIKAPSSDLWSSPRYFVREPLLFPLALERGSSAKARRMYRRTMSDWLSPACAASARNIDASSSVMRTLRFLSLFCSPMVVKT